MRKSEKGAVLILVLWILLAVSMLALSFSAAVRTEVDAARNVVEQKQAYYLSRSGIEYSIFEILKTQSAFFQSQQLQDVVQGEVPDVMRGFLKLELTGGHADIEIIDETGKINVNLAPDNLIFNLLIMIGVESEQADIITDSILDWLDPDDFVRQAGAESEYYQSLEHPYFAKNGFLDVPEELMLIQGITPEIYYGKKGLSSAGDPVEFYGLQNYLTTFTTVNQINVNSAPVPVLTAVPGLDYSTAVMIERMRSEVPLSNPTQLAEALPGLGGETLGYLGVLKSNIYTIRSTGQVDGSSVVSRIRAVIRVDGMGSKGYSVLYWNEANTEL